MGQPYLVVKWTFDPEVLCKFLVLLAKAEGSHSKPNFNQ
jgi:hypothetical protein